MITFNVNVNLSKSLGRVLMRATQIFFLGVLVSQIVSRGEN